MFESNLSLNFIFENFDIPTRGNFHPLQLLHSLRLTMFRGSNNNPKRKLLYTFHEAQQLYYLVFKQARKVDQHGRIVKTGERQSQASYIRVC